MIDIILVPQGAEYAAVRRGIGRATAPVIVPIPVGLVPLSRYLEAWQQRALLGPKRTLLVMGLCGGLLPHQAIGDIVLYQGCIKCAAPSTILPCDAAFTERLRAIVAEATVVNAFTSDRLVWSAQEKHKLAQQHQAAVVDMEGFAALEALHQTGTTIAMLRVLSDNAQHDLPRLANAISADGTLRPLSLAWGMAQQPIAAARLIRGSLKGLTILQRVAAAIGNQACVTPEGNSV